MATWIDVAKIKHHAVRSDGAKFLDGERNDALDTSWLTVNSSGRVTLGPGLYDELLVVKGEVTDDQIKTWAALQSPFFDPSPVIQESQIPAAETWNKAVHDAQRALADAADAQATADGKVTTFYQDTEPIAEALGDLWVHTGEGNKLYRWSGSSWEVVQDKKIQEAVQKAEDAQATADGKIVTFYQSTPPTATAVGDLWVDTDDNDRLHRWDGTKWIDITDKSPVDAEKKPVYVKGAGADIDIDKYGIRATRKTDGKKTFEIDAETGDARFAGDISGASGTFGNGSIHIGEDGLRAEKNGNTTFEIDSDGNAYFSGEISAASILSNSLLLSALTDFNWVTASNEVFADSSWSTIPGMTLQVTVDSPTVLFIIANSGAVGASYYAYYDPLGYLWEGWASAEVRLRVNGSVRVTTHMSPYVSPMFHIESVNPGTHTIQMEWRRHRDGNLSGLQVRSSYRGIYVLKLRR